MSACRGPPTTTTAIGGHQQHPPLPLPTRESPSVAQKRATPSSRGDQATTHQQQRWRATAMTTAIRGHHEHPPTPLSSRPRGPSVAHKRVMQIDKHLRAAPHQWPLQCATATAIQGSQQHPSTATHWAIGPWCRAQVRDVDHAIRAHCEPMTTKTVRRNNGSDAPSAVAPPLPSTANQAPKALVLHTGVQHP